MTFEQVEQTHVPVNKHKRCCTQNEACNKKSHGFMTKTKHFSCNLGNWEAHTHTEASISNQSSLNINQKHHLVEVLFACIFFKCQMSILWKIASRSGGVSPPPTTPTNHHQPPLPPTNPTQPPTNQAPWPWTRWYYRCRRRSPRSGDLTSPPELRGFFLLEVGG